MLTFEALAPSVEYKQAFLTMLDDFDAHDTHTSDFYAPARSDFVAYVRRLLDEERGLNVRAGWVPCTHRWLLANDEVVGVTRVRHSISTPFLSENGGHIGYDVAPSSRSRWARRSELLCATS